MHCVCCGACSCEVLQWFTCPGPSYISIAYPLSMYEYMDLTTSPGNGQSNPPDVCNTNGGNPLLLAFFATTAMPGKVTSFPSSVVYGIDTGMYDNNSLAWSKWRNSNSYDFFQAFRAAGVIGNGCCAMKL